MPRTRLLAFACLFATPALLSAHWISLTGAETASTVAEIHVLDDHVKVVLEISLADLDHFEELLPDPGSVATSWGGSTTRENRDFLTANRRSRFQPDESHHPVELRRLQIEKRAETDDSSSVDSELEYRLR